jgi:arylsulfatase
MQVYAGMVEALDYHIGRLINKLENMNELSNTVVIFMSDNGAEGNDPQIILENEQWIPANFDNSINNMGRGNSHIGYGPRWAEVSSTPFRIFKGFTTEGGIRSPAFVTYPKFKNQQKISDAFSSVMDITPTLLEIAGVKHPGKIYKGRAVHPIKGESLLPLLSNTKENAHDENYVMGWELFNRRALRQGHWKLVWIENPYGNDNWELYNLLNDPLEENNLAETNNIKLEEMVQLWNQYVKENSVIIDPDLNLEYSGSNFHFTY